MKDWKTYAKNLKHQVKQLQKCYDRTDALLKKALCRCGYWADRYRDLQAKYYSLLDCEELNGGTEITFDEMQAIGGKPEDYKRLYGAKEEQGK